MAVACAVQAQELARTPWWPWWRGPHRDNVVPAGTTTVAAPWNGKGPLKLWESVRIPSYQEGGLASAVVADSRVYLFATPIITTPVSTRKFSEADLQRIGVFPAVLPDEVAAEVEKARLSDERAALSPREVRQWAESTMQKLLPSPQDRSRYGGFVVDRLSRGASALPLDVIKTLTQLKDTLFESEQALAEWLDSHGISGAPKQTVLNASPRTVSTMEDMFVCLNADDGTVVWQKRFPGRLLTYGGSSTPCVARGRLYGIGSTGSVYCLNAATGETIWTVQGTGEECHSSVVALDNLAIVQKGALTAYDAATGAVVWTLQEAHAMNNTPAVWTSGGATYLLCNSGSSLRCVDLAGKILWRARGGSYSTPAVSGDRCVVFTGRQLVAYRISISGAQLLWQVDASPDRGASPVIWQDCAYLAENGRALCVELETGKVVWDIAVPASECGSAVIADGKLLAVGNRCLIVLAASPQKAEVVCTLPFPVAPCVTPAIAGNQMFLRLNNSVACYDLSRPAP